MTSRPVNPITYDRRAMTVGIAHFGVGNFHRSHQAMYLDRLLRDPRHESATRTWGICGVGVMESDRRMRDALNGQDYEYTAIERHPDGRAPATRVGSIIGFLHAGDDLDAVIDLLVDPATRIVSLTITEGGYNISDSTGQFDTTNPAVVADAEPGAIPSTVFGVVIAGLRRRRARGVPPFTIMSCDNVESNGDVARRSFTSFAAMVDPELAEWMTSTVSFPNCMVDRITPVTTDQDRAWVTQTYGVDDAWPVLSEGFTQWVLEDRFPSGRPAWEQVGVQLVHDVRPYEMMKLRLLNASHQGIAYAGLLAGHHFVHEAACDPTIVRFVRAYMDREASPTLGPVPGVDLPAYKDQLVERFASAHVRDTLDRLATDASDRIPKFVVPVIRARRAAGEQAPLCAAILAGWTQYARQCVAGVRPMFVDRQEAAVRAAVERSRTDPVGFLRDHDWFADLGDDPVFTADYLRAIEAFQADTVSSALDKIMASQS
ncbi:MAG: mannitol dehydrogenase family protein [Propionibacteriaceae bacterium]|jgi:mannitol 2-dehydrogenase|nr:mannitol dehydrogenase family protein [Propionibacteriaceae bacterium]